MPNKTFEGTAIRHGAGGHRLLPRTIAISTLLAVVTLSPFLDAQGIEPSSRRDKNSRIAPDVKHAARSITGREAMEHLRWLADDLREGRLAGSTGASDSAEYIAKRFEEIGVSPAGDAGSWFHNFTIPGRDGVRGSIEKGNRIRLMVSDKASRENLLIFRQEFLPHPRSADVDVAAICAFMLDPLEAWGDRDLDPVVGRFAVLPVEQKISDEDLEMYCEKLKARGAIGLMLVGESCRPSPSEVWPPADAQDLFVLPVIRVHGAGIAKIWKISGRPLSSWTRQSSDEGAVVMGRPHVVMEVRRDGRDMSLGRNVVGRMPGTDPDLRDEFIVVGAHYDHVGRGKSPGLSRGGASGEIHNGADDNASGVAALLEVAEAYALNRLKTRRTLLFVAFDAEELGLHGSTAFVADGGFDSGSIAGMVNMDMISRNQKRVVKVGRRASDEPLGQIIYEMAKLLELEIDETGMDAVLLRSDQAPFLKKGIPSVFFFGGFHEDYHKPSDDVEDVIPVKLQNVARLAFLTSWGLAQMSAQDDEESESADSDR